MLHSLLRSEGVVVNRKRTYRLYTELGMQVRPRVPMAVPSRPNAGLYRPGR
jgi:putative transposase